VSSVYLVTGEQFLVEEALDKIRAERQTDPLSEIVFDADLEIAELSGALDTPSLLGGTRLVVLRDAGGLVKDQVQAITSYIESPSPSAVLVLVADGKTKLDAAVKKHGSVISLEPPKGRRLAGWIRERARERKIVLDDRAAWALIDSVGTELRDLDGALEQLFTRRGPGSKFGAQDVRDAFPRLADERVFALTDAVGDRRLPVAMSTLRRLLMQGDPPVVLFGAVTSHIRRMLRARRHADQGSAAVASALGLPDWRAKNITRQARAYKEDELIAALGILAQADLDMKNGDVAGDVALESAIYQIVTGERVGTATRT
jgi:DNA polymerase-3 subunit delta